MKSITVKLEDDIVQELQALAKEKGMQSQSDLVRHALRRYIAQERLANRRAALARYIEDVEAQRQMADLAEADVDDAVRLLRRTEH